MPNSPPSFFSLAFAGVFLVFIFLSWNLVHAFRTEVATIQVALLALVDVVATAFTVPMCSCILTVPIVTLTFVVPMALVNTSRVLVAVVRMHWIRAIIDRSASSISAVTEAEPITLVMHLAYTLELGINNVRLGGDTAVIHVLFAR
jgi:hypothetical protein